MQVASAAQRPDAPHETLRLQLPQDLEHPSLTRSPCELGPGQRVLTRPLSPRAAFSELLPSWNATVPAGCRLLVDVQVGWDEGRSAAWSPWLRIGSWQHEQASEGAPHSANTTEPSFERGEVAVDVFRSEQTFQRARLAFQVVGEASVQLHRIVVVFSHMERFRPPGRALQAGGTGELERLPRVPPPAHGAPVPARSQRAAPDEIAHRICSPTSVTMAMAAAGVAHPVTQVAARLYDSEHDIYGNWGRAVQGAYTFGVPGWLERIATWEEVAAHLDAGRRLVISLRAEAGELRGAPYERTGGHLVVLWGLTGDGRALVNDPAAEHASSVPRAYACADLERCWMGVGGVTYVFEDTHP